MAPTRVSDDELLAELWRLGDGPESPPSVTDMNREGKYSQFPYYDRFGSWPAALDAAGFERTRTRGGRPSTPPSYLLFDLRVGALVMGRSPSYDEYDEMGAYSAATVAQRFGGWAEALDAADLPPTGEPVDLSPDDLEIPGTAEAGGE